MAIFFIFSDEAGNYRKEKNEKFLKNNPYYIRANLFIKANDWIKIKKELDRLRRAYKLPLNKELKYSYIWSIQKHRTNKKEISQDKEYYHLRNFTPDTLLNFVTAAITLLHDLHYCKIVITVTRNENCQYPEEHIYEWHIKNALQRIEMELQEKSENLGVLFIDALDETRDKKLRNSYANILREEDFIKDYKHVKDSLNLEFSHHSVGVQLADFVAGVTNSFLRRFPEGSKIFSKYVKPLLRKSNGKSIGYGILDIPTKSFRDNLEKEYGLQ